MKIKLSMFAILLVIGLAVLATHYRVSTAPERIRLRAESAKATCLSSGGQWVRVGRDDICQTAVDAKKP